MSGVSALTPPAEDTTAPRTPDNFEATVVGSDVNFSWVNRTDPDLDHLVLRRKQGSPPTSITDGSLVWTSTVGTSDMRPPFASGQAAGNDQLRQPRTWCGLRFVAEETGTLQDLVIHGKLHASESGYAGSPSGGADTGRMKATLYEVDTDGGADFAGGALADVEFYIEDQEPLASPFRSALQLIFNVAVVAGTPYFIVMKNTDPRNCDVGAVTSLNGAINDSVTTITLAAGDPAHVNGGALSIDGGIETVIIDSGGGTTTPVVQRGAYGSTAVSHLSGRPVQGVAPFFFSTNWLYSTTSEPGDLGPGVPGASGRNQATVGATDIYLPYDGMTCLAGTANSGTTWFVPSAAQSGTAYNSHHIPSYAQIYASGGLYGQPYYSAHQDLGQEEKSCYFQNITADWTIRQIGFYSDGMGSSDCQVRVNGVLVDTIELVADQNIPYAEDYLSPSDPGTLLGGSQYGAAWLTSPITLHSGDILKLTLLTTIPGTPGSPAGLVVKTVYADQYFADLFGHGSSHDYYIDPTGLDQGGAEGMLTIWPLPDRGRDADYVDHEDSTSDANAAGWAYALFAVDTQGNASEPAQLSTTSPLVGANLRATPGWATPGWFVLGGQGAPLIIVDVLHLARLEFALIVGLDMDIYEFDYLLGSAPYDEEDRLTRIEEILERALRMRVDEFTYLVGTEPLNAAERLARLELIFERSLGITLANYNGYVIGWI